MDENNDIDTIGLEPIPINEVYNDLHNDGETPEVQQWECDFFMTWYSVDIDRLIAAPQEADVKLGRGTGSNSHPGNQRYLVEVKRMLNDEIEANGGFYKWKEIYGYHIYNFVTEIMGGRFVKKITKADNLPEFLEGMWLVLEYADVKEKIQQVFRGRKTT